MTHHFLRLLTVYSPFSEVSPGNFVADTVFFFFFTTANQIVEASEDRHSMVWEHRGAVGGGWGGKTSSCLNCNLLCNPERIRALPVYKALSQSGPLSCLDL